jgi:hypothetical protein
MAVAGGFKLNNPCFQFHILHNHATDLRRNTNEANAKLLHDWTCCPTHNVSGPCLEKNHCDPNKDKNAGRSVFKILFLLGVVVALVYFVYTWWHRYRKKI